MNVTAIKYPEQIVQPYIEILKYKESPLKLLGTGSNASQLYPSDIDLFCKVQTDETSRTSYDEFESIIDKIQKREEEFKDMYFIEFKVQDKNGEKVKFYSMDDIKNEYFKYKKYFTEDIDFCKFDFVLLIKGIFVELSIIYVFNKDPLDYDVLRLSLTADMIDLIHEQKYYKSLKRLFAILKLDDKPDEDALVNISKLFNSEVGYAYKQNSIFKAIKLYLETYPEDTEMGLYVLRNVNPHFGSLDILDGLIKDYDEVINREGLRFYKFYYPFLLKLNNKNEGLDFNKLQGGSIPSHIILNKLNLSKTSTQQFSSNNLPSAILENAHSNIGGVMPKTRAKYLVLPKPWDVITDTYENDVRGRWDY